MTAASGTGTQWLLDLHDCAASDDSLGDVVTLESLCSRLVAESGLRQVGRQFHRFDPQGVTGVVLLSESHLAVHTWPERRFVAIDLYVCNHTADNTAKGQRLCDLLLAELRPGRQQVRVIDRSSA